ncbi:MAG TPA: tetratricopeptide repeat protein [Candidatus Aquilonibacter sp.]|nr:tetratricopeptide repeat protein [Candidatus Aquilonibacter sp.]
MDNVTKRQLKKQDQFITFTEQGVDWAKQNRQQAITIGVVVVVVILLIVGGYSFYQHRTDAASNAFGDAMQTYQEPLASQAPELQPGTKTFPDAKARAAAANGQFMAVADKYGMTEPGKMALYMAGVTYMEEGNNAAAENALTKVAGSWNGDVAALGKSALAGLYEQTGRNADAEKLLEELGKGHATTVPPFYAQVRLGDLYQSEGRMADAKRVWAEVKDKDKDSKGNPGPAAELASERLNPQATGPGMMMGQ